ncbi:MAG: M20/M25/M40 family metallo-hydrolase [Acidobacteriota bacterium]
MPRTHSALAALAALALALPAPSRAEEPADLAMVSRIRDEGIRHSQVMETVRELTDGLGPRLTGSPQLKAANDWTRQRLAEWGLANAHLESYSFGRGWSFSRAAVHMTKPQEMPLLALPKAYTPGTGGPVRGPVAIAVLKKEADLEPWKGKLAGKIVLLDEPFDFSKASEADPREYSEENLRELGTYEIPRERNAEERRKGFITRISFRLALNRFLAEEKVLATVEPSSRPWGVLRVGRGGSYTPGESAGVPALIMAAEQYNRLHRMVSGGRETELEIEVEARFHDEDPDAYNTIAEIPGSGGEVVMVGAHLDSWHTGTGATDDAAGCAIVMEAMRILNALKIKPRRTIRMALWSGEEQGLYSSLAYVTEHFGSWSGPADPERRAQLPFNYWSGEGTLRVRPAHAKLSAYFNVDNGGGKIRGIYAEDNAAVKPIFEAWLAPLNDLGADTVTLRPTGNTDHESFLDVGLPGFQFIQDELDYDAHTHHSNMDVYDHIQRADMIQASVVLASVLYDAAMRPEKLPRPPLPEPNAPQP